ncbi:hypothetical protein INT45_004344 [Circinella minor]|uniref:F-box domain-containing protein n=1 Tax=Circinella minor TaxID=1195481 RepID=A0A8H7SFA7_9FUNG|nr:hypothetical protein INT45_004344 [Circinella minor]
MLSKQENSANQTVDSLKIIPLKRSLEIASTDNNDEIRSTQTLEEIYNVNILPRIQNALNQEQNDKVIEESNRMLADLKSIEINVMKFQMNAWKNKGNLNQQLKYAKIIIEQAPKDSIGYINAAEVYSMRGQQVRARAITNRGMIYVRKIDKDGHAKLRKLDQDALCQISKRIDFIAELPYDLACMVANCFQFESLGEYIMVSRTWRERLLQYPTIWRRWTYDTYCNSMNRVCFLPKITAHIQELSVSNVSTSQSVFDNIIKLLESVEFPALRKLKIKARDMYIHNSEFLKKMGATVTHLSLFLNDAEVIPLSQVLMDCRNLIKLEYGFFGIDSTHFVSVTSLEYTTSLKELHVINSDIVALAGESLDGIIKNSPKLRVISLVGVDTSILPTIYHYCPDLVLLSLNTESFMDVNSIVSRISDEATDLQYLYLYTVSSFNYVKPFLEKHQNTLKELELGIGIGLSQGSQEDGAQNWRFLSFLKMPKLEYVLYDMESLSSLEQYVVPMIQHSPLIHVMKLRNFSNHGITDDMIQIMGTLSLHEIVIHCCKFVLTNKEAAIKIFQKLYDLSDVEIYHCFGTAQIALEAVASLPSLINLEIAGQNKMTMADLQSFIVKLVRNADCLMRVKFEDMTLNSKVLEKFQNGFYGKKILLRCIQGVTEDETQKALLDIPFSFEPEVVDEMY